MTSRERRLIGLDMGERRVGIAVGFGGTAVPRTTIDRADVAAELGLLCAEIDPDWIVIGLPTSLDGSETASADNARAFALEVATTTGHTVVLHDERFSTVIADRDLGAAGVHGSRRKQARDQVAATVVLQSYLDGAR